MLKELKVYESLCDPYSNGTTIINGVFNCDERDSMFSAAGTVGTFSNSVCVILMGVLIEKFGIFKARAALTTVVTFGLVGLMLTPQVNWLVFPVTALE